MEEEKIIIKVDLEQRLRLYMPSMFRLLAEKNLKKDQWRTLNRRFAEEHIRRTAVYDANGSSQIEANLFDLINASIRGNRSALRLVGYFDVLFKALDKNLLPNEKVMVRDTLYSVLINFDHKFRNFIGELAVLDASVADRRNSLLGVEIDIIAGNKSADFTLLDNVTQEKELIEVLNIHLDDSEYLSEKLNGKIREKITDKTCNHGDHKPFTLVPVVWASVSVLQDLLQLYKSGNGIKMNGVHEPFAYCVFADPNDLPIYRFCRITNLFPENKVIVRWVD